MAEKDKTFYWLKLKKEFMDGEVIDFLMSQKNGANYVVLYQKLIMETLNTRGKLCSEIGEVIIPFDAEKIQRQCKWFDLDTVRVAMELYCRLGLIYKNQNSIFEITNFEELVGSESYWAKIKREERKTKELDNVQDNVQKPLISNISNLKSNIFKKPSIEEVREYCKDRNNNIIAEKFIDFYESKGWYVGKNKMKDWKASVRLWEQRNKTTQPTKPKLVRKEATDEEREELIRKAREREVIYEIN